MGQVREETDKRSKGENEGRLLKIEGAGQTEGERLTRHHCAASPLLPESDCHLSWTNRSLISQMEPSKYPATRREDFFLFLLSLRGAGHV